MDQRNTIILSVPNSILKMFSIRLKTHTGTECNNMGRHHLFGTNTDFVLYINVIIQYPSMNKIFRQLIFNDARTDSDVFFSLIKFRVIKNEITR